MQPMPTEKMRTEKASGPFLLEAPVALLLPRQESASAAGAFPLYAGVRLLPLSDGKMGMNLDRAMRIRAARAWVGGSK